MNVKKIAIRTLLVMIGLPVVLILIGVATLSFLNKTNGAIVVAGEKREYLLYVPKTYDRARPTPLVISMHGAAG